MKRIWTIAAAALLLAALLAGCGGETASAISMLELDRAMRGAATQMEEMLYVSSEDPSPESLLAHVSDLDYEKVRGFFIDYAANGTGNADELVAIQVKRKADADAAAQSLRRHLEKRRQLYSTYDKTQLPKLEAAQVLVKGDVALLIVAADAAQIAQAAAAYLQS